MKNTRTFGRFLRNPLTVFGLILLAGDGPLVVCYGLSRGTREEIIFAIACIVFVFAIGGFFCFMVLRHTRKLFSPSEIPIEAIGHSIFSDSDKIYQETMDEVRKKIEDKTSVEIQKLRNDVLNQFVELMAHAGTTEPTIKRFLPDIEVMVREAIAKTRMVDSEAKRKFRDIQIQVFVESARRRILIGQKEDVIPAADILSQLGTLDIDGPILREALKREDLSDEARETLERAIRDLEKKRK